jgi:hypothetical protein
MYLPLTALIALVVVGLVSTVWRIIRRSGRAAPASRARFAEVAVFTCVAALAAPLAARTIVRNRDYTSHERIWRSVLQVYPDS